MITFFNDFYASVFFCTSPLGRVQEHARNLKNIAEMSIFGRKIVHGMLIASLFSGLLGEKLPGKGTIYLGQTITFIKPVFINEEVTASVEIKYIRKDKPIYTLKTICETKLNGIVVDGEAIVKNSIQSG